MILVASGAARNDGFSRYAALAGPGRGKLPLGGYSMEAFRIGRIVAGTEMTSPSTGTTLPAGGAVIGSTSLP